jgi:cyclopropane fatty-acyl-phospholipid synthase-like methyltransferase
MGEDFHFGYFETEDMDLPQATRTMADKLLEPLDIGEETRVLDVGCGIGGPAFLIHERYRCAIDGITTSQKGVNTANQISRDRGYDKVRFKVADGMNNGFPDNSFDIVWIMEASHTMPDKKALFQECFRVLKQGGSLAMCDLAQLRSHPNKGVWRLLSSLQRLISPPTVWGPVYMPSMGSLCDQLIEVGFIKINTVDISKKVIPTLKHWIENARRFRDGQTDESSKQYADEFIKGCIVLENAFKSGITKYGMLFALKES